MSSLDFAVAAVAVRCQVDFAHEIQAAGMAQWYADVCSDVSDVSLDELTL